eukprot:275068_1
MDIQQIVLIMLAFFLRCNSLPGNCNALWINFQFNFVEVNEIKDIETLYVKDKSWGLSKAMKRDPNLSKLTIKVKMEQTVKKMNDGWIYWKIKGYLLDEFKSCKVKKPYYTPAITLSG